MISKGHSWGVGMWILFMPVCLEYFCDVSEGNINMLSLEMWVCYATVSSFLDIYSIS